MRCEKPPSVSLGSTFDGLDGSMNLVSLLDVQPTQVLDYFKRNQAHLAPSMPLLGSEFYEPEYWNERRQVHQRELDQGVAVRWVIVTSKDAKQNQTVMGHINLTQIFRGPSQSGVVGYGLDRQAEGKGLMSQALGIAIDYAFEDLALHRIQANYRPENVRSEAVLHRLGFVREGFAKDYLKLNGAWCDHVLTSKISPLQN